MKNLRFYLQYHHEKQLQNLQNRSKQVGLVGYFGEHDSVTQSFNLSQG